MFAGPLEAVLGRVDELVRLGLDDVKVRAADADDVQIGGRQPERRVKAGQVARDVRVAERVDDDDGLAAAGQVARDVVRPADLGWPEAARIRARRRFNRPPE